MLVLSASTLMRLQQEEVMEDGMPLECFWDLPHQTWLCGGSNEKLYTSRKTKKIGGVFTYSVSHEREKEKEREREREREREKGTSGKS